MKAYGYVRKPLGPKVWQWEAGARVGTVSPTRSCEFMLHHVPPARDQGSRNACVGFAIAVGIETFRSCHGLLPAISPSPRAIYYQARRREGMDIVVDSGCNPADAWQSCREVGVVSEAACPYSVSEINLPPAPEAYSGRVAADNWLAYYWVLTRGEARVQAFKQAMASGHPVEFAIPVDAPFEEWHSDQTPWNFVGPRKGWHYVCGVGYTPDGVLAMNSWGANWGTRGIGMVGWKTIVEWAEAIAFPVVAI